MVSKIAEEVIRRDMPKARLIEQPAAPQADRTSVAEATAPDLETLVSKYLGRQKSAGADDASSTGSVEMAQVVIETPGRATDTARRLAKRTLLIDKNSKAIFGSSG